MIKERKEKRVEEARRETESLNSEIRAEFEKELKAVRSGDVVWEQHLERRLALQERYRAAVRTVFTGGRG